MRTGVIAMLATASDDESGDYLRSLWRSEPERRAIIAMALAQNPDGENWDYLVRSLSVLDDQSADDIVKALRSVRVATDDPMAIRQLVLLGLRADESGNSFENVELVVGALDRYAATRRIIFINASLAKVVCQDLP